MSLGLVLALALATLIGMTLATLGSGSVISLPVLVYVAGIPPHSAVPMSLAVVGGTALVGAVTCFRQGYVHVRATVIYAITGAIGAFLGAHVTPLVPPHVLMLLFACLLLVVGAAMVWTSGWQHSAAKCRIVPCLAAGVGVGFLTGFLGASGGFLIVSSLVLLAGLDSREAVGTSLAVITLNSITAVLTHLHHVHFNWKLALAFLAFALLGMKLGIGLAGRLSERKRRRAFGWSLIVIASVLAAVNLGRLL